MVTQYQPGPTPAMVGSPTVPVAPVQQQTGKYRPFRMATLERADIILQYNNVPLTAAEQQLERTVPGTGYVYGFDLEVQSVVPSANSAAVAYLEDAPYSAISSIIFKDVNGEIINAGGWGLYTLGRYGGWIPNNPETSTDPNVYNKVSGAVATGGNFTFHLPIPIARDRRTLLGLLGNQDRNQSYTLRTNIAAAGAIYSTAPTVLPNITQTVEYESYAVPNATDDMGVQNQVEPSTYGTILYIAQLIAEAQPQGGSQVVHFVRRLGFTERVIMLVFRSNGTRANAENNMPTNIQLKIGNQTIFNETTAYRRKKMWDRYGFDAPAGVLVYDFIHDFDQTLAGSEFGHDYLNTQNVNLFQFLITYPSGFGSNNNSLTFLTSDMVIPNGVNIYAD